MVTMSIFKKETPKKKTGLLGKMFGTHQTKPVVSPETKKALVSGAKTAAKHTAIGAGMAWRGLQRVGENIERSGMFEEYKPSAPTPKRSEYLPTSRRYKKARKVKKTKSRLQELQEAGLI